MEELRRLQQPGDPYRWYDGPMPGWKWIVFDGAVSHMVPNELRDLIVIDLERRGCGFGWEDEGTHISIDQPGPIATTRPVEHFYMDGLDLEIPCEDVGYMLAELASLPLRGGCYYKLHGDRRCIVLTQSMRDQLLAELQRVFPEAEAKAAEFWHGRKTPIQVFREYAGVSDIKGGDQLVRFHTKSGSLPN